MASQDKREESKSTVLRINRSLARAAEQAGALYHRKPNQQIEYWASLGRAFETMPGISRDRIEAALSATLDFDALSADERVLAIARLNEMEAGWQAPPMPPSGGDILYAHDAEDHSARPQSTVQPRRIAASASGYEPASHARTQRAKRRKR